MDQSTPSKTDNSNKLLTVSVLAEAFTEKLIAKELPFQKAAKLLMPVNMDGKPISTFNFNMLASGIENDPRWLSKKDADEAGFKLNNDERATPVIYFKKVPTAQTLDEHGEPVNSSPSEARIVSLLAAFNGSQLRLLTPSGARVSLPKYEPQMPSDHAVFNTITAIVVNAGLSVTKDQRGGVVLAEGSILNVSPSEKSPDSLGETLQSLVQWARQDGQLSRMVNETFMRELLVEAMATSMLCAEIGAPVPQKLVDLMDSNIENIKKYIKTNPSDLLRMGKEAWNAKEFVATFVPNVDDGFDFDGEQDTKFTQQAKSLMSPN